MLDFYDENSWLFDEKAKKTGFVFSSIVWAPLLRKMVHLLDNIIEVKGGEPTNTYTQYKRKMQFNRRSICDLSRRGMVLTWMLVHWKPPANKKILEDEGKLLVETKDIVLYNGCWFPSGRPRSLGADMLLALV
ncbi:hypothetical protein EDC94DRAFT_583849 [Helicostylum pulchrum]|nr:hypothetical protein EDC94DRAFT_583849 [Helicostylum pulchrum]